MSSPLTVALADDDDEMRRAYRAFFSRREDVDLVGEAADGRAGVTLYRRHHPDVMLMDLQMPVMGGAEAIAAIRAEYPSACIVVLTTFNTDDHIASAIRAGAMGYLTKHTDPDDLVEALHAAIEDRMPLSPGIGRALRRIVSGEIQQVPSKPQIQLTPRERDILDCMIQGVTSTAAIAAKLFIVEGTVKQYIGRLSAKLGVHGRTQILIAAIQEGLIMVDPYEPN